MLTLSREVAYDAFVRVMESRERPEDVLEEIYQSDKGAGLSAKIATS